MFLLLASLRLSGFVASKIWLFLVNYQNLSKASYEVTGRFFPRSDLQQPLVVDIHSANAEPRQGKRSTTLSKPTAQI